MFTDELGIGAFVCLKDESEEIYLQDKILPVVTRKKICTLRIAERYRGQRIGEGAIGLALWNWQKSKNEEIYLTVFPKHNQLIGQLEKFGFELAGYNNMGERVYIKSRKKIDYSDPYKSFPFINSGMKKAGYLIVDDIYHDTLFPYSELSRTIQPQIAASVANGLSKIYIGKQFTLPHYKVGEPIMIYRRYTKNDGQKPRYKSCITSYCMATDVIMVKRNYRQLISFEDLCERVGNKSVFDKCDLRNRYDNDKNVFVIEMLYYGFFGAGHNVNNAWLSENGLFKKDVYPARIEVTPGEFKRILQEGDVDVTNVIIN